MRRFLRAWRETEVPGVPAPAPGPGELRRTLLDGAPEDAVAVVAGAVAAGVGVPRIIDVIASVAASRLGRFDIDSDTDDSKDAGWLDVTHTLTYTNALRWAWAADPCPEVLRGVMHAAWFVQWTAASIMVAHAVKATMAAISESESGDRAPLAAAGRFLAAPKRERFVYQATLDAIAFIQGRAKGDTDVG
jgi:hypothetical protein